MELAAAAAAAEAAARDAAEAAAAAATMKESSISLNPALSAFEALAQHNQELGAVISQQQQQLDFKTQQQQQLLQLQQLQQQLHLQEKQQQQQQQQQQNGESSSTKESISVHSEQQGFGNVNGEGGGGGGDTTTAAAAAVAQMSQLNNLLGGGLMMMDEQQQEMTVDENMMGVPQDNGSMGELLQQMVVEQQKQQLQEQIAAAVVAEAAAAATSRPNEHFLTVARDGTILGVTETVTGFPPNSLLMTSAWDVHNEDLTGLLTLKTQFWEKGRPQVDAYLRRRNLEGELIWLASRVVSFIDTPVPGFILHERKVSDERVAIIVSRTCKIMALLIQGVEDAEKKKNKEEEEEDEKEGKKDKEVDEKAGGGKASSQEIPGVADDAAALKNLLSNGEGMDLSESSSLTLQQLMEVAANGGTIPDLNRSDNENSVAAILNKGRGGTTDASNNTHKDETPSLSESIRSGPCVDMSQIELSLGEVKMITLVVTGRLKMDQLTPLVMNAMSSGHMDIGKALDGFSTERELELKSNLKKTHVRSMSRDIRYESFGHKKVGRHVRSDSLPTYFDPTHMRHHPFHSSTSNQSITSISGRIRSKKQHSLNTPPSPPPVFCPPALCVLNLAFTKIGNHGIEMLSESLYVDSHSLKSLDVSFCNIKESGILSMCRALQKRKRRGLPSLQGVILAGNYISYKAAKELGMALSHMAPGKQPSGRKRSTHRRVPNTGYDEDDEFNEDDDEESDDDVLFSVGNGRRRRRNEESRSSSSQKAVSSQSDAKSMKSRDKDVGLQILHLGCTSLSSDSLYQLLLGLGHDCPLKELSIPSNNIGPAGASLLVTFLESKGKKKNGHKRQAVMPYLDRLDLSNNNIGNDGTAKLTRAISKRVKVNIVDLRLSSNNIGSGGIETILNKLLQHNLLSLSLDNNTIGDRGCQLVAASLPSMHHISKLNLSFNQIGSRGVTTLMRSLTGCDSITYLGLSGNVMKISGAIAMGFALSQHPRLAELELDNCCLSQVAQCHIVAGIISNRWVPMRRMVGFRAGPPMVAIGALEVLAQHLNNEECFRIRRDIQMKAILQWMETNRAAREAGSKPDTKEDGGTSKGNFLTVDFIEGMNDVDGAPSQSAYLRMLDWLSRIPFDEDELTDLRKYFFDIDGGDGGDGMRGSDGNINLKHRGDLLAALASDVANEIRDVSPVSFGDGATQVGLCLDEDDEERGEEKEDDWNVSFWSTPNKSKHPLNQPKTSSVREEVRMEKDEQKSVKQNVQEDQHYRTPQRRCWNGDHDVGSSLKDSFPGKRRRMSGMSDQSDKPMNTPSDGMFHVDGPPITIPNTNESKESNKSPNRSTEKNMSAMRGMPPSNTSVSSSKHSVISRSGSDHSTNSQGERRSSSALKARITMFPQFAAKLDMLKGSAQDMMDQEEDPNQQDVIAQQFAEASLTLLRQLRYHCMNSGLDGWRKKIRRKVLIVDDSVITRKMVSRAFEKANFIVDTAENGMEGVAKLKQSIYDIAFMDIDMPVMNGFDATRALRVWEDTNRPGARQPICALTAAYVDDFERSELMKFKEAGLDVMESKPCNIPRLFKVVDDVSPMFSDLSISVTKLDPSNAQVKA